MSTDHESVALVPETVVRPFARAAVLAALTGATAIVAIPIPFSQAPISLQVLFVFLAGLYLGPVWGAGSMFLYLVAGAAGAPVFAGWTAGLGVLVGKTGGFLWSYPIAAFLIGAIVHGRDGLGITSPDGTRRFGVRDPADVRLPTVVAALVLGTLVIYAMGATYGMWLLELTPVKAITLFVAPFVVVEAIKLVAAVAIVRSGLVDPT